MRASSKALDKLIEMQGKKIAKKNLTMRMSSTNFRLLHQKFPSSVLCLERLKRKTLSNKPFGTLEIEFEPYNIAHIVSGQSVERA